MKKYITRISISVLSLLLVGVITLAIHLYLVTPSEETHHQNWQLSRIDFEEPITDEKALEIHQALKSIDGIKATSINRDYRNVIYSYETSKLDANAVYAEFMTKGNFNAKAHPAPDLDNAGGCPVIDRSSLTYKISALIKKILPSS